MFTSWRISNKFRARAARTIVILVSDCIEIAYMAYCQRDKETEEKFANLGRRFQKILFPVARKLDKDAMVNQMVTECWWG